MKMLGSRPGSGAPAQAPQQAAAEAPPAPVGEFDDDIPF